MRIVNGDAYEIGRFFIGGSSAVATDSSSYWLLLHWGVPISEAKLSSFVLGSIVGFLINKRWTFRSSRFSWGEIVRYCVLYAITAFANVTVNAWTMKLTQVGWSAFFFATAISTVINFLGQKFFVFRTKEQSVT